MRSHGERAYPGECCGALLGTKDENGWRVEAAVEAGNARADSLRTRYRIAPQELAKIARIARDLGLAIAGFYHSHPDAPAQWSETDLDEAHWTGCSYVITAINYGRAAQTNAFALVGSSEATKRFEPELIELAD